MLVLVCGLMALLSFAEADASEPRWVFKDPLCQQRLETGRALVEVQSTNWPSVLPHYTRDIEYHDPIVNIYGISTMAEFLGRLFGSSPDLVTTVADETLSNGVYTATWTMSGQFTGVPFSAKGMSMVKFRAWSTSVHYSRDYYTEGDIMANIPGLDQVITAFRTYYRCAADPTFECPQDTAEALADLGTIAGAE